MAIQVCEKCRGVGWNPKRWKFRRKSWYLTNAEYIDHASVEWDKCECNSDEKSNVPSSSILRTAGRKRIETIKEWDVRMIDTSQLKSSGLPKRGPSEVQLRHREIFVLVTSPSVVTDHTWEIYPVDNSYKRFETYKEARDFVESHFDLKLPDIGDFRIYIYF